MAKTSTARAVQWKQGGDIHAVEQWPLKNIYSEILRTTMEQAASIMWSGSWISTLCPILIKLARRNLTVPDQVLLSL